MSDDLSGFSLMDLYRSEAESNTATLSAGLLALEEGSGPDLIEPMMRAAHSLKGAGRIVGLDAAVKVAHAMEDCFVAVQERKCKLGRGAVDVLLRAVDLLTTISGLAEDEFVRWAAENDALVDGVVAEILGVVAGGGGVAEADSVAEEPPLTPPAEAQFEMPLEETESSPTRLVAPLPTAEASPPAETSERVVRVTAESLTRLMSLAGESLVQSRQLRPFVDSLLSLKGQQSELLTTLQTLQDRLADRAGDHELMLQARTQANRCALSLGDKMRNSKTSRAAPKTSRGGSTTRS